RVLTCAFHAAFRQAVDRRHFRARVRCWNRNNRKAGLERDRFAQSRGGTAADRDSTVGTEPLRLCARFPRGIYGHVHDSLREYTSNAFAEALRDALCVASLLGCGQDERPLRAEQLDLPWQILHGARSKNDPSGLRGVEKLFHRRPPVASPSADTKAGFVRRRSPRRTSPACTHASLRIPSRGRT